MYIHNQKNWPKLIWDKGALASLLANVRHEQGLLLGQMKGLGFRLREEAVLETLTSDVIKTSEIEGEKLDPQSVRSSIARRLGMDVAGLKPANRHVEGIVEMMLDATRNFAKPLTQERLFGWQASLFPTGRSGMTQIRTGGWRDDKKGPMQVVSGPYGKEKVHYEAPAAPVLKAEMTQFLKWFNETSELDAVLKAGIAHFWFVTIHPFDDGNGRIARAIADLCLARSEKSAQRFYSMSAQIEADRKDYYDILEASQKGGLDITEWLAWFLKCLERAIKGAEHSLSEILSKAKFWEKINQTKLNERQKLVINKMLDGFEGNLTSSKWAKLTKSSQDTASRDILDLIEKGILEKGAGGGRNTHYSLILR